MDPLGTVTIKENEEIEEQYQSQINTVGVTNFVKKRIEFVIIFYKPFGFHIITMTVQNSIFFFSNGKEFKSMLSKHVKYLFKFEHKIIGNL